MHLHLCAPLLIAGCFGHKSIFPHVQTKKVWQFFTLQIMHALERPLWPKYPYMHILVLTANVAAGGKPEGRNKYLVSRKTLLSSHQMHDPSVQ